MESKNAAGQEPVHLPSIKQVAMALAKAYKLPYKGTTETGRPVHMPSVDQIKMWVEKNS